MPRRRLLAVATLVAGIVCASSAGAQTRPVDPNDALFQAARSGDLAAAQTSLAAGASVTARDGSGLTAAEIAVDKGHFKVAHFLLSVRNQAHQGAVKVAPATAAPRPVAPPPPVAAPAPAPTPAAATPPPPSFTGPNPFDPSVPVGTGVPGFQASPGPVTTVPLPTRSAAPKPAAPAPPVVAASPPLAATAEAPPPKAPAPEVEASQAMATAPASAPVSEPEPVPAAPLAGEPVQAQPSPSFMQRLLQALKFSDPAPKPAPAVVETAPAPAAPKPVIKAAAPEPMVQAAPKPAAPQPVAQAAPKPAPPEPMVQAAPKPTPPEPMVQAAPKPAPPEPMVQAAPKPTVPQPVAQAAPKPAAREPAAAVAAKTAPLSPSPVGPPDSPDALGQFFSKMASFFVSGDPKKLAPAATQAAKVQAAQEQAAAAQPAPAAAAPAGPRRVERPLVLGVEGQLGRQPPPTGFGVKLPCIEKRRKTIQICVEDVTWPAEMKPHFAVESVLYKGFKIITRYNDGRAAFIHTLFASRSFAAVVGYFTRLYGEPTETWTRTIAPLGEPRRGNPVMVWFGYDKETKQPVFLEVRQFDDARADFPDTERGAVLLHYEDATPIFPLISKIELMRIRN